MWKLSQERYLLTYKSIIRHLITILYLLFLGFGQTLSQNEITVVTLDNPSPGYLFLQSNLLDYIGFVDNSGKVAYKKKLKESETAITLQLQPNERISYFSNNKFYIVDYDFNIIDSFACKNGYDTDFHDLKLTSDGHAFLLGIKYSTVDMSVVVTGGKPDAVLWSVVIQEQDENKNVVWEWSTQDHYQVTDATSDIDLTQKYIDWVHTNWIEIDYDGNILISSRYLDEITKINKQTGDIIWRLGGKGCKNNQFTFLNDTVDGFWGFSHQHTFHRLSNGNLLLYDNGNLKPVQFSRAVEYEIDEVNKTIRKVWEYHNFPELFSLSQGSVQRLPNGNTIIGWGTNHQQMTLTEVRPDGSRAMGVMNFDTYLSSRYPVKMASKLLMAQNSGNYSFSDTGNKTGVALNIYTMTGSGYVSVERHYYSPHNISFEDSPPLNTYGHRWVLNNKGISQFYGKIFFSISDIESLDSPEKNKIYWRKNEGNGSFKELETTFNQTQGTLEANISSFGEFIIAEPQVYQIPLPIAPADDSKKNPTVLDLIWRNVIGADSYRLQVSENKNFTLNLVDSLITSDTSFILTGLENNKTYYWRLKSVYGSNESNWSNPRAFTTLLKSPELIEPADNETDFPVRGLFEWDSVAGATYYKINISKTPEFDSIAVDETGITDTSYSLAVLDFGRKYYWRVKAMNFDNEGLWSDINTFTTEQKKVLSAPILLSPLRDTVDVPLSGLLIWNPVADADKYNLELSFYPDFLSNVITGNNIDSTSQYYNGLNYNTIYYWHVSAENQDDTSSWSDTWRFTTQKFENINETKDNDFIVKFLENRKIIINLDKNEKISYFTLFDLLGREILKHEIKQNPDFIDCSQYEPGIFIYFINVNGKTLKGKVLIY